MSVLLTCTQSAIPIETVPAIKITHFNKIPKADNVYAYARLYVLAGALQFCFTRFEEKPSASVRMGLALCSADAQSKFLYLTVSFEGKAYAAMYDNNKKVGEEIPVNVILSSGGDEQGLYCTAQGALDVSILRLLDKPFEPKTVFAGNIYSYDETEAAFGSVFKVPLDKSIPNTEGFEAITCVSY